MNPHSVNEEETDQNLYQRLAAASPLKEKEKAGLLSELSCLLRQLP